MRIFSAGESDSECCVTSVVRRHGQALPFIPDKQAPAVVDHYSWSAAHVDDFNAAADIFVLPEVSDLPDVPHAKSWPMRGGEFSTSQIGALLGSLSRCLGGKGDIFGVSGALSDQDQLPDEQTSLNSGRDKKKRSEQGQQRSVFDESRIHGRFRLALGGIVVGFALILFGSYIAFNKKWRACGVTLFCLGSERLYSLDDPRFAKELGVLLGSRAPA